MTWGWLEGRAVEVPAGDGWLAESEKRQLGPGATPARRADWRLGRWTAKRALAAWLGLPTSAAYGATKAALINLAESLKYDCDRAGVKLQLVSPGFVKTPLTDKNDFAMPHLMPVEKAVARMIAGLQSNRFEITFPRRFTWQLKLLRVLPYRLYFAITRRRTGA